MKLTGIDIGIFIAYIVAILSLGLIAARRTGATRREYFLAGDKLPWWMVGGSIVAANISSHHFVSIMGVAYVFGFAAMNIAWPAIFTGFFALLWIFLPFYLRNGFYTMPEFLDRRFGGAARTAYGGLIFLTYVFVEISAVLYLGALAMHTLFPAVSIPYAIIGLAILTATYTITGGLRAVVWTEMLQLVILMTGGAILSIAAINHPRVGGLSGMFAHSHEWHLLLPANDQQFPWTMFLGGLTCISVFYCAANQFIVQRALAAKDEWHARTGIVFTHYLQVLLPFIYIVPGLVAPLIFPHLPKGDMTFPTLVENLLPPALRGIVMAGLISAIMSHVSGAVNSCTTIATVDFYLPYFRKDATEAQAVRFGKLAATVVFVLSVIWGIVFISQSDRPVFIYLLNVYGYFTPGIATMFLLGILWKRTTHAGALAAGLLTIPLTIALEMIAPKLNPSWGQYITPFMNRTGIVFWACMLTCVLVSLVTKPKSDAGTGGSDLEQGKPKRSQGNEVANARPAQSRDLVGNHIRIHSISLCEIPIARRLNVMMTGTELTLDAFHARPVDGIPRAPFIHVNSSEHWRMS